MPPKTSEPCAGSFSTFKVDPPDTRKNRRRVMLDLNYRNSLLSLA
jgi:hypothetical protein